MGLLRYIFNVLGFYSFSLFFWNPFHSSFWRPWTHILIWASGLNFGIWLPFFPCAILWGLFSFFVFVKFLQLQNHITHITHWVPAFLLAVSFQGSSAVWAGHSPQVCGAINWVVFMLSWSWIPESLVLGLLLILLKYLVKFLLRKIFIGYKFSKSLCYWKYICLALILAWLANRIFYCR